MGVTNLFTNFATGNDTTGDGSSGNPYKTLQGAITNGTWSTIDPGNVLTATGAFTDGALDLSLLTGGVPSEKDPFAIIAGDTSTSWAIAAGGQMFAASTYDWVHISGFTITGMLTGVDVWNADDHCGLFDCVLDFTGLADAQVQTSASLYARVRGCEFRNITNTVATAAFILSSSSAIEDCWFKDVSTNGGNVILTNVDLRVCNNVVSFAATSGPERFIKSNADRGHIEGNTIFQHASAQTSIPVEVTNDAHSGWSIINNYVEGCAEWVFGSGHRPHLVHYDGNAFFNCVGDGLAGATTSGVLLGGFSAGMPITHTELTASMLVDPANNDFRPVANWQSLVNATGEAVAKHWIAQTMGYSGAGMQRPPGALPFFNKRPRVDIGR